MFKNKTKKIAVAAGAIAVAAVLSLSACGGSQNPNGGSAAETTAAAQNGYEGTYTLYAIGTEGGLFGATEYGQMLSSFASSFAEQAGAENTDEISEMADIGNSALEVKGDGTAQLTVFGEPLDCTWTEEGGEFVLNIAGAEDSNDDSISVESGQAKGTIKNGVLTLKDDASGSVMVLVTEGADTSEIETMSLTDMMGEAAESMTE